MFRAGALDLGFGGPTKRLCFSQAFRTWKGTQHTLIKESTPNHTRETSAGQILTTSPDLSPSGGSCAS